MSDPKPAFAPKPGPWRSPLILREAERLAVRLGGVSFAGYAFWRFPFDSIADFGLRTGVSFFSAASVFLMMVGTSIASPVGHRRRLAARLYAENRETSIRVGFVLYIGERRISADDGIVTFEGGLLIFTGLGTTFRLGRSHIESATRVTSDGPEKRFEIIFEENGEGRRIAFDDKSVAPHVWDSQALQTALEGWMAHAPADSTSEPPPSTPPPSRTVPILLGLLGWLITLVVVSLHLRALSPRSHELTVTIQLFLGLAGMTLVGSLAQVVSLHARIRSESLAILLDRPLPRSPLESAAVPTSDDATPRQTTVG